MEIALDKPAHDPDNPQDQLLFMSFANLRRINTLYLQNKVRIFAVDLAGRNTVPEKKWEELGR
jgi:hypothetical protein